MLDDARKVLIVHHWDADGISTAALLKIYLRDAVVTCFTPTIGNFYLSEEDRAALPDDQDAVVVADIALPQEDIDFLSRWEVIHIDHHLQEYQGITQINPIISGGDPSEWPSASWVATKHLEIPLNLLSVYGVLGDVGERVVEMPIWKEVEAVLRRYAIDLNTVMEIVSLIDSSYKVGDREGVVKAVDVVREHHGDPDFLLNHTPWRENLDKLRKEMDRLRSLPVERVGDLAVLEIETNYNLISELGRYLAARHGAAMVVNRGYFRDRDQIYLRRTDGKSVEHIIEKAKGMGLSAGGKKEVVGIVVPKEETDRVVNMVVEMAR